jgi:uncharacterized LabA/DUF88 family protein
LAREHAYDWAVLVSSDLGLIPVVKFVQGRGKKIVHAAFPPVAVDLSRACRASIDLGAHRSEFEILGSDERDELLQCESPLQHDERAHHRDRPKDVRG